MNITKRNLIKTMATAAVSFPLLSFSRRAEALSSVSAGTSGCKGALVSSPEWRILGHATDGTNPSTALGGLPKFTHDILSLENKPIELTGYIQPLGGGFARQEYLLSSAPFHCPFCYGGSRASLVRVLSQQHLPDTDGTITVTGTLALQGKDPEDYYFILENAQIS